MNRGSSPRTPPLTAWRTGGGMVYVSGQLPRDADGAIIGDDIGGQTRQVIQNLRAVLAQSGCTLGDVVKTTAWLTSADDLAGFNAAYAELFDPPYPARSTVVSGLVAQGALIELEAVACAGVALPGSQAR